MFDESSQRSSLSNAQTDEEIGEYWDEHDSGELSGEKVRFKVESLTRHILRIPVSLEVAKDLQS